MDYAEVRQAFFQPRDAAGAGTSAWQSAGRRLRDAVEPIATVCWWSEPAYDAYAALGLDFLTGYAYSRGCVLGAVDADVVAAAFGVFEPSLVKDLWSTARERCSLDDIRAARLDASTAALREVIDDADTVTTVAGQLRQALRAADPTGRVLFAGLSGLPWPADPFGALWHACVLLREYRGDSHLAACVAAGLSGLEANLLTEMQVGWPDRSYTASRGWAPDAMDAATELLGARGLAVDGELTDAGVAARRGIEDLTDLLVAPVVDALDADLDVVVTATDAWSTRLIEHGWFPPDPYKRASG